MIYSSADMIPYSSHVTPDIIKIKGGSYMMCFRLRGVSYIGNSQAIIDGRVRQLNKLITQMKAPLRYNLYVHSHCIRHEYNPYLDDNFEQYTFADELNNQYVKQKINATQNITTDYFFTIIYRPYRKIGGKSLYSKTRKQLAIFEEQAEENLGKVGKLVEDYFADYEIKRLTTYVNEKGILFSEQLQFLNLIANLDGSEVPVLKAQISEYLPTATLSLGSNEIIKINNAGKRKFAAMLTLSEYPSASEAGQLQEFMEKPWQMIISQFFIPIDKSESAEWLKRESRRLLTVDDASESDFQDLDDALEGVQSDFFVLGNYSWTALLIADDIQNLQKMISEGVATLSNCGFTASVNIMAKLSGFYSQLPGNLSYQLREAKLSSVNAVHMFPYQVQNRGKQWRNPWGCALSMFKTTTDEVFFFNFHDTEKHSEDTGKLVLGNTVISGQSGTGKTVLLSFLLAQSQRYRARPRIIIFDKDLGSSVFVRAMNGAYSQVKLGEPTGFNPFHLDNIDKNRAFLGQLIRAILSNDNMRITASERNTIDNAIKQVMSNPLELRDIESFANYLPDGDDSIRQRLYAWTQGEYAWVFNNSVDNFSLNAKIIGIDYTEFLEIKEIRSPILMYLFHRIELMLDGTPTIITLDEAWYPLSDEQFQKFLENKDRTIRKENGLLIFATQSPSDFFNGVSASFMEQIATQIYLPNPAAKYEDYVEKLGLEEEEYVLVKDMGKSSREFLVKYQGETTHCKLDLNSIDAVNVLSGSEARSIHAAKLAEEYGDRWLEQYYQTVHLIGIKEDEK